MKIQFCKPNYFYVKGKEAQLAFNPDDDFSEKTDVIFTDEAKSFKKAETKKVLHLPGEFELSGVLIRGLFSDESDNVVYKVVLDDLSLVYFGNLSECPTTKFFENLGENMDVVFLTLSETFNDKKAKELLDKVEPRMAFISGDEQFFPKMVERGAKIVEENPMTISRSSLSEDKTEIVILQG